MVMIGGLGALSGSFLGAFVVFGLPVPVQVRQRMDHPDRHRASSPSRSSCGREAAWPAWCSGAGRRASAAWSSSTRPAEAERTSRTGPTRRHPAAVVTRMIRADSLARSFGGTEAVARRHLPVDPGEVVGFLGPNGAGKTTTIRMLLGLLRPSSGRAEIERPVGYLPEAFAAYDGLSVRVVPAVLLPGQASSMPATAIPARRSRPPTSPTSPRGRSAG